MSMPFHGKKFTFRQPDGTKVEVRGWGNQRHAVFETLDGFTVVQDPATGYVQYAKVTRDGDDLSPIGANAGAVSPRTLGLKRGARISAAAAKAKAREGGRGLPPGTTRWEERRRRFKNATREALLRGGPLAAPPQRETVGDFVGLCLLIDFPDVPATIERKEVEAFCNREGYKGFGNNGSVYDYFMEVSGGRLRYKNVVAPYYTAKHPREYYTDEKVRQPKRTRELIKEALTWLKGKGFDFKRLTVDDGGYVYATNVFYAGECVNAWAKGLWPHAYNLLTPFPLMAGKRANDYQITNMGAELTLATFCHENGHMICDFPDLYDYGDDSNGVGVYCLMCAGGSFLETNPAHVGAYLKYRAGWASAVTRLNGTASLKARAGKNEFFLHAKNKREYFIIENRRKSGRDLALPSSGLAIWHVDELGDNEHQGRTAAKHYECSLVQADGRFDLERDVNDGDKTDLFHAGGKTRFGDTTSPRSRWWDGTASQLEIKGIGAAGAIIKFSATV